MFRRSLPLFVALVLALALQPVALAAPPDPPKGAAGTGAVVSGLHADRVLLDGRSVGRVVRDEINCVGHATGIGSAVYLDDGSLAEMLEGLGYACRPGGSDVLAEAIAAGKDAMMVYLHLYPPDWREPVDRDLSYDELGERYGWSESSWRDRHAFFSADGRSLPIDYHVVGFSRASGRWEWVARARDKNGDGSYGLDSHPFEPAAGNPDLYFPRERVLVSLACSR